MIVLIGLTLGFTAADRPVSERGVDSFLDLREDAAGSVTPAAPRSAATYGRPVSERDEGRNATFGTLRSPDSAEPRNTVERLTQLGSRSLHVSRSETCPHARAGLVFYRFKYRSHLHRRGIETAWPPGRKPRNCADARYLADVWTGRAYRARKATERHVRDLRRRTLTAYRDWQQAVQEVQGPYPGTSGWLLSCSASEGGWGRWVPNSQGSGVGGWLQFYPSTFWRMYGAAERDVRARGYIVPNSAASWYSPLGQALAGAWGVTNGRRHEWHGPGC